MAGPAIRSYEVARALQPYADVTLAGLAGEGEPPGVPTVRYELREPSPLRGHIAAADAVIAQPQWPHIGGWLRSSGARLIFDAYDRDPSFESVIDLVPFGVPADPPRPSGRGPRERFPEIGHDDEIVLWNGGLWSWLDAPTAIRAAGIVAARRPGLRLVFMGAGTQGPARRATEEARGVAGELGLLDRTVLFNDSWVPYAERGDWLLDADCALSSHVEHLETRFAFRP